MKVKQIIELRNIENEIIDLDIKNRILLITFSDYIKQQMIALRIFGIEKNIHVITDDDRIITLVNMISCTTDDEKLISYIKFDHIFIGINIENEKIDDINKYIVTFENKNITKENKHFEYNSYQITLGKNFVEITDELQKRDSDEYLSAFLEIYELICLFVGYFPLIKKIEIYIDNNVIEEYGDLVYLYYSSNDIMHNSFSLVGINDINNFDKIMEIWKNLKEEVGEYPILGLFISQMKSNHYLEYILVTLLQSIDGYGSVKIRNKLSGKSEKDKRIIEIGPDTFNNDALIMKGLTSHKISLKNKATNKTLLTLDFTGFPYLGLWSKPNAPFLCIEPWYSTADTIKSTGVFIQKQDIISLKPKETFECKYTVEFF